MMQRLRRAFPYFFLLLEVVLFYRRVLFGSARWAIPWDLRFYHFPQIAFLAKCLREGVLPLWNPYVYCGMPWYAKVDSGVFYPPTVLAALASNAFGGEHLLYFVELQLIAHVLIAGIGTYWLLRKLGAALPASLIAATIFQLGAFFATQAQHLGAMNVAAWMPLASLAVVSLDGERKWRWACALAVTLALSILAGFPASTIVTFTWCGALILALVIAVGLRWTAIPIFAGACVGAVLLSAVQVLPTLELIPLSHAAGRAEFWTGGGLPLGTLWTMLWPNRYGVFQFGMVDWTRPENPTWLYLYCGVPAVILCLAGLWRARRREFTVFAILTAFSALWMFGNSTWLGAQMIRLTPGVLRSPMYIEFWLAAFTLGIAICAGISAQALLGKAPRWAGTILLLVCAADLLLVSSGRPFTGKRLSDEPGLDFTQFNGSPGIPGLLRGLVNRSVPPTRIDIRKGNALWNNGATLLEIPAANGDDPFALRNYLDVRRIFAEGFPWTRAYQVTALDNPVLDLFNIEYVISLAPIEKERLVKANFEFVREVGGEWFYRNREVLPRFFLAGKLRRVSNRDEAIAVMKRPDFDPRVEAVIEGALPLEVAPGPAGTVMVERYEANRVELKVTSSSPSFLVTSEPAYPGWRAAMDGRRVPLVTTNGAFRGLAVPAGTHAVSMRFRPGILIVGAGVSFFAFAALAVIFMRS